MPALAPLVSRPLPVTSQRPGKEPASRHPWPRAGDGNRRAPERTRLPSTRSAGGHRRERPRPATRRAGQPRRHDDPQPPAGSGPIPAVLPRGQHADRKPIPALAPRPITQHPATARITPGVRIQTRLACTIRRSAWRSARCRSERQPSRSGHYARPQAGRVRPACRRKCVRRLAGLVAGCRHGRDCADGGLAPGWLRDPARLSAGGECDAARADLPRIYPTAEYFHGCPHDPASSRFRGDEFGGIIAFPFPSTALCRLVVHDRLVSLAESIFGTEDIRVYAAELWARYSGAADYEQEHHRDYLNHTPLVNTKGTQTVFGRHWPRRAGFGVAARGRAAAGLVVERDA